MPKLVFRNIVVHLVCYLYVFLFVYAAVSKIVTFETFQLQLGQSPLLSPHAGWISYAVPGIELLLVSMFLFPKTRRLALYGSFGLMLAFLMYIYLVVYHSPYLPCSCGGLLDRMGWDAHLIFNGFFVLITALVLIFIRPFLVTKRAVVLRLIVIGLPTLFCVYFLSLSVSSFIPSANRQHRKFPPHIVTPSIQVPLGVNSYYFSGVDADTVYLGNSSTPLQLLKMSPPAYLPEVIRLDLSLSLDSVALYAPKISVVAPYFYLYDGIGAVVYRGCIRSGGGATLLGASLPHFTQLSVVDSTRFIFRGIDVLAQQQIIGAMDLSTDRPVITYAGDILTSQHDGFFDVEGSLMRKNSKGDQVYVYRYRNGIVLFDNQLSLQSSFTTIDTHSVAKLHVVYASSMDAYVMSKPPKVVNKQSAIHGDLLLVQSMIPGQYESKTMWEKAVIIDIYSLSSSAYLASFYLYPSLGSSLRSFVVGDHLLFALSGQELQCYLLSDYYKKLSDPSSD